MLEQNAINGNPISASKLLRGAGHGLFEDSETGGLHHKKSNIESDL